MLRGGPRLGMYFFEKGNGVRGTGVVYDRAGSSIATAESAEFDWKLFGNIPYVKPIETELLLSTCSPSTAEHRWRSCIPAFDLQKRADQ